MNILLLGDVHYRARSPRGRKDDYVGAQRDKIEQVFEIAEKYGVKYVLQPGDLFDTAMPPLWLINQAIRFHRNVASLLCVLGQHDQRYHHTARENTPVGVMEAARTVRVLGTLPYIDEGVEFYGSSWGEQIPLPREGSGVKVLVMHRMTIQSSRDKLWPGQEDYITAEQLTRQGFDLVVTGDNHRFFTHTGRAPQGEVHVVNCGSLMRSDIDQKDHRPTVVLYNTDTRKIKSIPLKVAPASEVLEESVKKSGDKQFEAFVERLRSNKDAPELDFLSTLSSMSREKGVEQGVRDMVNRIVEMSEVTK